MKVAFLVAFFFRGDSSIVSSLRAAFFSAAFSIALASIGFSWASLASALAWTVRFQGAIFFSSIASFLRGASSIVSFLRAAFFSAAFSIVLASIGFSWAFLASALA